ncbi:uncharacterized protein LOC131033396 isoform X2 [Cryptomeria japonica]|uniref:uncharacterized protein LOC131033396 isoform X2 n=1 Tax=Cryptomeria japonica TaxID=3369 RepID=UPI0027DA3273|nr:uncharacterized protein LOC131033396 isoform X2 [Cryptomeria japonica]
MSSEYSSKTGSKQSTGNTGLSNPRAKRRLNFEQQGDAENVACSSKDEAFRDLVSLLRGVMALKKQKRISSPIQDMHPKPRHGVTNAKRRLHLESLQTRNQQQWGWPCLKGCDKTTKVNIRAFQGLGKDLVHELPFNKDTREELGDRVFIQSLHKRSRVSLKERGIAPASLGLDVLRVEASKKTEIMRNSQKFSSLFHNLVRMPGVEPSKENVRESDENAGKQCVDEIIDQSSKNNSTSSGKGLGNAPPTQRFQEYCATLQLELGCEPKFEGSCQNGKELFKGSVLEPMNVPLDENLSKTLKFEGSYQNGKDLLKVSVLEPLDELLDENSTKELSFEGSCQNGRELLKGSVLGSVNEPMDEILKKEPKFEGHCQNVKESLKGSVLGPLNEPWNENLEKEPKFDGICKNVKELLKGSFLGPVNEPFDENVKKSGKDRGNTLGNEVIDKRFKKDSIISAKKCRSRVFGKPSAVLHQGLDNQSISQDLLDLSKVIDQELVNESVDQKLKISNQDRSEQLGLFIDLNIENCEGNGAEERATEPLSQGLEIPCEFLREGLHNDPRMNMNSKKFRDSDDNSVSKAPNMLFDGYCKESYGVINQKDGNEIIDCRVKKYSRGSIKKQRTERASQFNITACAILEGGLCYKPRIEENNQNFKDLDKPLVQHPVRESVDEKIYYKERSMEPVSDVNDQAFLKCSKNSTKENVAEHASEGFEKSRAVLRDGLGSESKIQNSACSVGPKVEINLNSANPFSISPVTNNKGPYPDYDRPGSEECREIRNRLLELHGFPEEFKKFRARLKEKVDVPLAARQQLSSLDEKNGTENVKSEGNNEMVSCIEKKGSEIIPTLVPYEEHKTMLDSLISTLLSQNTTEANSRRAFASLKKRFPTWDEVYKADPKAVEDAIRCGGLAEIKTSRIKNILKSLLKEQGKICLEHLRNMPVEKIKAELCRFKGVGSKTDQCTMVSLFINVAKHLVQERI